MAAEDICASQWQQDADARSFLPVADADSDNLQSGARALGHLRSSPEAPVADSVKDEPQDNLTNELLRQNPERMWDFRRLDELKQVLRAIKMEDQIALLEDLEREYGKVVERLKSERRALSEVKRVGEAMRAALDAIDDV